MSGVNLIYKEDLEDAYHKPNLFVLQWTCMFNKLWIKKNI